MTRPDREDKSPARGVAVNGLHVKVGGRTLLENAAAEFPKGRVTLVIGPSGSGKTVLGKIIAGLLGPESGPDFEVRGSVSIDGVESRAHRQRPGNVGIVFQNFALFDELSVRGNLEFARSHRTVSRGDSPPPDTQDLIAEFEIPRDTPVRALSGGQQQRLAVARTLAYDPPAIIYDEPTSGLDPRNARRVAERIRSTSEAHHKTTIVVTHDYQHLAPIADRVYLLDVDSRALRRLSVDEVRNAGARPSAHGDFEGRPGSRPRGSRARALRPIIFLLDATGRAIEKTLLVPVYLLPIWRSPRWGLRYFLHYLWLLASPGSVLYFLIAGVIAGFVTTHFAFKFLPHRSYSEPLIADELLNGLGFVLYRVVVPVLVTVLIAARCGAAVASDVGNRAYSHQVDAMRSFRASPRRYLLTNILLAFLVSSPALVALGFLAARFTSLVAFVHDHPEKGAFFWDRHFHRDLRVAGSLLYYGSGWLLAKTLLCGLGVGSIACHTGLRPKLSGVQVSRGITSTIIWATLYVLAVHFVFAFLEF